MIQQPGEPGRDRKRQEEGDEEECDDLWTCTHLNGEK